MNEELKKTVHEKYKIALQKGERFWPDSIFKDLVVSFGIFILLLLLATFVGVPGEPKADPSDSAYIPKPEWYFLFLFKFLAIYGQIPVLGKIEWITTALIPGIALLILFILPLTDKNPYRHYSRRILALTVMGIFVTGVVALTMMSNVPTATGEDGMSLSTLFQFLAGLVLPGLAYLILVGLSFLARKSPRPAGRAQIWTAGILSVTILVLAMLVVVLAPPAEAGAEVEVADTLAEKMVLGQDLYSVNCVECHGADGEGGEVKGVEGFEGVILDPLNSSDVMYTYSDESLANVIAYGQQASEPAMPPFGRVYGGELSPSDMDYIVTFMRYTWDDRAELPAEAALPSIPALAAGEVPSYEVHIQPLVKRYCVACHRAGKENNNYLMGSYEDILNGGDNAGKNVTAGSIDSYLIVVINDTEILDPKTGEVLIRQMPPSKLLKPEYIDMLTRWIMAGMPNTAAKAQALSAETPYPQATPTP